MTDLEWLARHVHEWRDDYEYIGFNRQYKRHEFFNMSFSACHDRFTRDQWLAERARIQNKPSVDEWPEWVNWIAQWSDGQWIGYDVEPAKGNIDDPNDCYVHRSHDPNIYYFEYGEVLGDWRDTLERRPNADTAPDPEEYTGKSVSYYTVTINKPTNPDREPYDAECNDIIEALGMSYAEGNAFKAIWRRCAARTLGKAKRGYTDGLYDAEKAHFFAGRMVAQETD